MQTKYVVLWLEGPFQAWGFDSKFQRRDTLRFPTKSGLTGMLLAARGLQGAQKELLSRLASLDVIVLSFSAFSAKDHSPTGSLPSQPILEDFHMVGAAYNQADEWETLHIPKTSEGKKAVGGGTKLTYRYYLQDAKFCALMQLPAEEADAFAQALSKPAYDICLGRKNCVPTEFVFQGVFDHRNDALAKAQRLAEAKQLVEHFRVVSGESENGDTFVLNDVPVQFGRHKIYRDRRVTLVYAEAEDMLEGAR